LKTHSAACAARLLLVLGVLLCGTGQAAVQVQAQVDTSQPIYARSPFIYNIVIANGSNPDDVDLKPIGSFNPVGPSVQNRTSIINGQRSSYIILSYQLTAPDAGETAVPAVAVKIKGQTYHTSPVTITVAEPGTTKQIDIETSLSTHRCYVGQPVIYTVTFYVWADIVQAQAITNIDIQAPILNEDLFYIEDSDLQPANAQQTILPVNGQKALWYQDQVQHSGVDCVRLQMIKVLIPKQAGTFQLKASTLSADLAVSKSSKGRGGFGDFFGPQYEYNRFAASSKALDMEVLSLPQEGKPADFYGLVGNYTITTAATPTQVNVGDPITLTIHISGGKFLKPVQWPKLENIPVMSDNFKRPAEQADGQIKDGVKVFTQTIRANNDKVTEIPAIPLTFFDAAKGGYVTIASKPIPLTVSPTKIVTGADVETQQLVSVNKEIEALKEGLSANYTSTDALENQQFSMRTALAGPAFIVLWAVPFAALLSSATIKIATTSSPRKKAARRRKLAGGKAAKAILAAGQISAKTDIHLAAAMKQYIAEKFDRVAGSLTAEDCRILILEHTKDSDLAGQFKQMMEEIEASAYSPMDYTFDQDKQKQILQLLKLIER
jgi:hypothetical protein